MVKEHLMVPKKEKLKFCPTDKSGWYFKRTDLKEPNLIKVEYKNSSTTNYGGVNNIVLASPDNPDAMVRLTEHIIALRTGLRIDNLIIETDSYDPPLFENGSFDIVEVLKDAGRTETLEKVKYYKIKEKTIMGFGSRGFLLLEPPLNNENVLLVDCAISYSDNIMKNQRICFPVTEEYIEKGAIARTNCPIKHAIMCKTIGKNISINKKFGI